MESISEILKKLLAAISALFSGNVAVVSDYVWPLSNSATPDEMNTSFGPRINRDKWDFHDGTDLPAKIGTNVHAMRAGTVYRDGPGGTDGNLRKIATGVGLKYGRTRSRGSRRGWRSQAITVGRYTAIWGRLKRVSYSAV